MKSSQCFAKKLFSRNFLTGDLEFQVKVENFYLVIGVHQRGRQYTKPKGWGDRRLRKKRRLHKEHSHATPRCT
jgi:hypothetical protein